MIKIWGNNKKKLKNNVEWQNKKNKTKKISIPINFSNCMNKIKQILCKVLHIKNIIINQFKENKNKFNLYKKTKKKYL
jgi:hypothetical protein